jgi:hypothetical protein
MFALLNMFSESFAASATRQLETGTTVFIARPYSRTALSRRAGVRPPTGFCTSPTLLSGFAGSSRSGENARWKSTRREAGSCFEGAAQILVGCSGIGRRFEDNQTWLCAGAERRHVQFVRYTQCLARDSWILVRVVVAHAHGRRPRARCARVEANLEARVPTRGHCTRQLHDGAEVRGIRRITRPG